MNETTIVVMGGSGVGKSSLCIHFVQRVFVDFYNPTIEDMYRKIFEVDGKMHMLEIIDTAGTECFRVMHELYIKKADGIVLLFSLCSPGTLTEVQEIYEKVGLLEGISRPPIILGGTKCDLIHQRMVTFEASHALARSWGCPYIEISSKNNLYVDDIFDLLVRQIQRERDLMAGFVPKPKRKPCVLF